MLSVERGALSPEAANTASFHIPAVCFGIQQCEKYLMPARQKYGGPASPYIWRARQKFRHASPSQFLAGKSLAPWVSVFKPENASPSEMEFSRLVSGRICCNKSEALVIPSDMTVAQPGRLAQLIFPLPC
jgi:hypothetical protein